MASILSSIPYEAYIYITGASSNKELQKLRENTDIQKVPCELEIESLQRIIGIVYIWERTYTLTHFFMVVDFLLWG